MLNKKYPRRFTEWGDDMHGRGLIRRWLEDLIGPLLGLLIILGMCSFASMTRAENNDNKYHAQVISVYDGDTFTAMIDMGLGIHFLRSVRILGIDTPERRGKCAHEKAMALQAKAVLEKLLGEEVILSGIDEGKWAGRALAYVRADGVNVAQEMIEQGLARPYYGGKRGGWCDEEPLI